MKGRPTSAGRLPDRLRTELAATGLIRPRDSLVVGVSGGLDSVVLLHLLRFSLSHLDLRLTAAHLDHGMRPGSRADALWVRGLCRAWGVPCHPGRLDPPARSEADARERRYAFLEGVARELPAVDGSWDDASREPGHGGPSEGGRILIATGHHRDDQAETVLFRAIRGTGLRGLRGIARRRGRIIRPLLSFRRSEIREYAEAVGLRYRIDPTNRELTYARNRIRHVVLPALEAARPGAAESLARLADQARSAERGWRALLSRLEEEVVIRTAEEGVVLARSVLRSYDPAVRGRLVRHLLRRYGSAPDRGGTRAALEFISSGPSGGELHMAGGVRLERDFDEIRITVSGAEPVSDIALVVPGPDPGAGRARIGGRWVEVVWGPTPRGAEAELRRASISGPAFPLTVRGWRPGDRIRLPYGTKKLKALFREHRLARRARRKALIVEDGEGTIVWVVGVARAEGVSEDGTGFHIAVRDAGQH